MHLAVALMGELIFLLLNEKRTLAFICIRRITLNRPCFKKSTWIYQKSLI